MAGLRRFDDLPGLKRVAPRSGVQTKLLASLAAAAWPPILLTLPIWPPTNWASGVDTDWRLVLLLVGLVAAPVGIWLLNRSFERTGRPSTRLGVVLRFLIFGGLLAAALQTLIAIVLTTIAIVASSNVPQAIGAAETTLLIFGVAGLPLATLVGLSYSLWAGLCVAFIGYRSAPAVRNRMGLMPEPETAKVTDY